MNRGNIFALRDKLGRKSNKLLLSVAQVLITMLDHPTHQQVQLDSSIQREYPLVVAGIPFSRFLRANLSPRLATNPIV